MKKVLTIAGSDSSGGAGIQADLKTIAAHNLYGMSVLTALTAQNTLGVDDVLLVPADFIRAQIKSVFEDIVPDALKIGMLGTTDIIETVVDELKCYHAHNIVVDPVMVATSGSRLLAEGDIKAFQSLFSIATVITPNVDEAAVLAESDPIRSKADLAAQAEKISRDYGCAVLVTGGDLAGAGSASDYLFADGEGTWFESPLQDNPNTHGTGCTLSSAIASYLALDYSLVEAIRAAKDYINGAIAAQLNLGKGRGPLHHNWKKER